MPEVELNNLARIGQLDKVPFSPELLRKMLATAHTRLTALVQAIERGEKEPSPEHLMAP